MTEEKKVAEKPKKKIYKKKKKKHYIAYGRAYIQASYNNTIITITDKDGNTIAWASAGHSGFKGPKKATPYAAGVIVSNVIEKIKDSGLKSLDVFVKGVGSGRESAIRALNSHNINILSIKDVTPIPHNGCRPPKVRRV